MTPKQVNKAKFWRATWWPIYASNFSSLYRNRRRKNRRKSTTTLVPRIFASADREFVTSPSFLTTTTTVFTPPSPPPVPEPEEVHGYVF